jgi:tetratricopeptide (TPR) repeat protein
MAQFAQADAAIKKCLKINPYDLAAQRDEEKILQGLKKWNELTGFITVCLKQQSLTHGDELEFLYRRANAFTAIKDYDKAIADYKLTAKKEPEARQPHASLLEIYKSMGKTAEANKEKAWLAEYDSDVIPTK